MNLLSLHFTMEEPAGLVAVYTVYGKKNVIRVYLRNRSAPAVNC